MYLGSVDVARDAYLVLAATAQEQYVRWRSDLNLSSRGRSRDRSYSSIGIVVTSSTSIAAVAARRYYLICGPRLSEFGRLEPVAYLERAVEIAEKFVSTSCCSRLSRSSAGASSGGGCAADVRRTPSLFAR